MIFGVASSVTLQKIVTASAGEAVLADVGKTICQEAVMLQDAITFANSETQLQQGGRSGKSLLCRGRGPSSSVEINFQIIKIKNNVMYYKRTTYFCMFYLMIFFLQMFNVFLDNFSLTTLAEDPSLQEF